MLAKLKPMAEILRDPFIVQVPRNNHYWKFYYSDKPALGFRDFYLKYWRGDRLVTVKPKKDRKKNFIQNKLEVYGKRGNYVFTAYTSWFDWIGPKSEYLRDVENSKYELRLGWVPKPKAKPKARDIARKRALTNLSWNELFDI